MPVKTRSQTREIKVISISENYMELAKSLVQKQIVRIGDDLYGARDTAILAKNGVEYQAMFCVYFSFSIDGIRAKSIHISSINKSDGSKVTAQENKEITEFLECALLKNYQLN